MVDNEQNKLDYQDKEKRKKATELSIKEGTTSVLMDGFGTRYISPYAISIGANNLQVGLLSTLPGLLGNLFQLPFLLLMRKYSRKKIVTFSVLTQAILWLPIIFIGFLYFVFHSINAQLASNLLIIFYSIMVIAGSVSSPSWNSWMKDLVQENNGEYFGRRNKIVNIVLVITMILAGLILNIFPKEGAFKGFLIIFFIGFLGRAFASFIFTKQYEPNFKYSDNSYFSFLDFTKKMFYNNFGRFVVMVSLVSFATAVAGPFFAVYMIKDLKFSYLFYTLEVLSGIFTMIIFMPIWGKFADKYGNVRTLKITGFMVPFIPVIWLGTIFVVKLNNPYVLLGYCMMTEGFSGLSWAGFNLSLANFIFDAVSRERTAFCVAYFNIINTFGSFIGSIIGGYVVSNWDYLFGIRSLFIIFTISALLRFLFVLIMTPWIKEVRTVCDFDLKKHLNSRLKIGKMNILRYIGLSPIDDYMD